MRIKLYLILSINIAISANTSCFSQFTDFRNATVFKINGDSIVGKVDYKINFGKYKKITVKESGTKNEVDVSELNRIKFHNYETYTVLTTLDSERKKLAKTFAVGYISLYQVGKLYYLKKDTSLYTLDDRMMTVKRGDREYRGRSQKYLNELQIAFRDCPTLDYIPLKKGIQLKKLTILIEQYGKCQSASLQFITQKPIIEVASFASPSIPSLNASFVKGAAYYSGAGFSFGLSLLKDIGLSSRIKMRIDLNYLKSNIKGSFSAAYEHPVGTRNQYITYSSKFNGLRMPVGLQYYFFNNNSSFYLACGFLLAINKYAPFDTREYIVYDQNGIKIFEPYVQGRFQVKQGPLGGQWCALGGDFRLSKRLKANLELRAIRTNFDVYFWGPNPNVAGPDLTTEAVSVFELSPSVGLKYKLR